MSSFQFKALSERKFGRAVIKSLPLLILLLWGLFLLNALTPTVSEVVAQVEKDVMATLNQSYGGE